MASAVQLAYNPVVAKLYTEDRTIKAAVSELLSYAVEGAEFMHAFQSGSWNGRSTFYAWRSSTFPAGFVHLVYSELRKQGHEVRLVRKPLPVPDGLESPIVDEFGNDDPRYDYQLDALRRVEKHGRGIIQVATGGGKSKIAKLIVHRYRKMTLFITTRGVLMYQMKDGFMDAGLNVGVIGDGVWAPVKGVNVGMVQTLVAKLQEPSLDAEIRSLVKQNAEKDLGLNRDQMVKMAEKKVEELTRERNRTIKLLEMVEVVIGEEAHEAGGNSYYEILKHCKNAHIRVALTATPFMRDGAESNMRLMAAFGPILIKVSEQMLIDRGILAKPYFRFVESEAHPKLRKSSPWQRAYQLGYVENGFLNGAVVREAVKAAARKLPVMTLVQRKNHGEILKEMMESKGLKVEFIRGENDQDARRRALDKLKDGRIDVLIGTTILDVGVDVPAVGVVQLAGGGKAEVALRQRIGRGLRAKKSGPNVCFISDYSVAINSHLREHARQRRAIIEATPGFAEQILPAGADFDWSLFDEVKAA